MKSEYHKISKIILGWLYPRHCPVCGKILGNDISKENPFICPACYRLLNIPDGPRCLKCSRPVMDGLQEYCRDCEADRKHFDCGTALLMHDSVSKKIIYDLKYSNQRDHADMLAYEAAQRFAGRIRFWDPEAIIPIPLHRKKERERGFNQAFVLGMRLSEYLKEKGLLIPVRTDLLVRNTATRPMKSLTGMERKMNIRGAFALKEERKGAKQKQHPHRRLPDRVLLIDDIYTSGSTISECARVLKAAGVGKVYFLTFSIG